MLEMYLKLHAARTVSAEPRGKLHGKIGRDEILSAGGKAAHQHPLGHYMVLADDGDEHAIKELADWAKSLLPELYEDVIAVALGRPTTKQLNHLIFKHHQRYDRARRKAVILNDSANHLDKQGKVAEASEKRAQAERSLALEYAHCKADILTSGKCPRCRGTGVTQRSQYATCQVCNGSGNTTPPAGYMLRKYGSEMSVRFYHIVDELQMARADWLKEFHAQINRERAEA